MNPNEPILIVALPRSRTAWLAAYFGLYHDLTQRDLLDTICAKIKEKGLSDSGLLFHYRAIADRFPAAKWVFVEREPEQCFASLKELQIFGDVKKPFELCLEKVAAFKREVQCKTISFEHLDYPAAMRELHQFLGVPFDYERHTIFKELKITSLLWQRQ